MKYNPLKATHTHTNIYIYIYKEKGKATNYFTNCYHGEWLWVSKKVMFSGKFKWEPVRIYHTNNL